MPIENGMKPTLTGRVDLGHLIQAGILVITVAGAVLGTYFAVQGQIAANRQDVAVLQQQEIQTIKWMQQIQDEQKQLSKDITIMMSKITDQLTDLRILVASVR